MASLESIVNKGKLLLLAGMLGIMGCSDKNNPVTVDDLDEFVVEDPVTYGPPSLDVLVDEEIFNDSTKVSVSFSDGLGLKSAFFVIDDVRYDFDVLGKTSEESTFNHDFSGTGEFDWYSVVENDFGQTDSIGGEVYVVPKEERIAFVEDYSDYSNGDRYLWYSDLRVFEEDGTKYLRAKYVPSDKGSLRLSFRERIPSRQAYTLEYSVMFEEGFEFVKGGKLPGLGSYKGTTGGDDVHPDHWNARIMWRGPDALEAHDVPEGVEIYYYDPYREEEYGSSIRSDSFKFEVGQWYNISLSVKVNDPFENNGVLSLSIDGDKIVEKHDVKLRDSSEGLIEEFHFSTFFGGNNSSWSPSKPVYSRFSEFTIYKN